MRILSATEAVSPAFRRMKAILFRPFRLGRTWKLAATGYIGGSSTTFFPFPLVYLCFIPIFWHSGRPPVLVLEIVAGVVVLLLIYGVIFYLISRLHFAFFDIVLNRGEFVTPAWRKYGTQSRKWTLFKVCFGTLCCTLAAIPLAPLVVSLIHTFEKMPRSQGQNPPPELFGAIGEFYLSILILYAFIGLFILLNSLLSDFIVPSLALEDVSLKEAFGRAGRLVRNEFGAVCFYAFMKVVLYIIGSIACTIFFYLLLFVLAIIVVPLGIGAYYLLNFLHAPHELIVGTGIFAGILLYIFIFLYGIFFAYGVLYTFMESYSLYFLGGRYPLLGDLLERSTPPSEPMTPPANYLAYATPPNEPL